MRTMKVGIFIPAQKVGFNEKDFRCAKNRDWQRRFLAVPVPVFRLSGLFSLELILAAILSAVFAATVTAATVSVDNRSSAPQVAHGVNKLEAALNALGHDVRRGDGGPDLAVTIQGDAPPGVAGPATPEGPESFSISTGPGAAHVAGADAVGAMYGVYDLLEQIEMKGPGGIEPRAGEPFLKLRAVNPFFHVQAFEDPDSWYYDEKYWETYLDELSMARYNLLDIHAMYHLVTTKFPNAYLYLLKSDRFPEVGVPAEQAKINLKMFNRIIDMADERGIRVSLMSYHASWEMHLGHGKKVRWPSDEELEAYTAEMVRKIIDRCPKLWMVGFRIGESGRRADFFVNSYIKGLKEAGREVYLFTRTWAAPVEHVLSVADAYPGRTFLEIKYNGEQLGLPYHALTSMTVEYAFTPSYSYENYLDWPRKYEILWQIRANGTHRLFRWGDPEFARRTMLTCRLGDGAGFTMEPMTAYYPPTNYFHKAPAEFDYFTWDHQRNWFWYHLWGRTSYDPDTPEDVWLGMFEKRFGREAARAVYDTVVWYSRIVPFAYSYRFIGPDHRSQAPEYEHAMSLRDFLANRPLDSFLFRSCDEYVDGWIHRHPRAQITQAGRKIEGYTYADRMDREPFVGGRVGPFEFAETIRSFIENSENAAAAARQILGESSKEFNDIDRERRMLKELGGYYADKFLAATHLGLFMKTFAYEQYKLAEEHTRSAHAHWEELSKKGKAWYRPLLDTLRMKTENFTWEDEIPKLAADFDDLKAAHDSWEKFRAEHAGDRIALGHLPPLGPVKPGAPVTLRATVTSAAGSVTLKMKDRAGLIDYSAELKEIEPGLYGITVPGDVLKEGAVRYAFEVSAGGETYHFPRTKGKPGAYSMIISGDAAGPAFELLPLADVGRDSGKIRVRVTDGSGVRRARLYYKPMPTGLRWKFMLMKPVSGEPGVFEAEVVLDRHGLLYFFAAEDELGNAAQYPDGRRARPYLILSSWRAPAVNPHLK